MTPDPSALSDQALCAALAFATHQRALSGCLMVRTELARLKREYDRRIEILMLEQAWDAS